MMGRAALLSTIALLSSHVLQVAAIPPVLPQGNALNQMLLGEPDVYRVDHPSTASSNVDHSDAIYVTQDATDSNTETVRPPSWFTSTLMARRLLALSTIGTVSSTFPDDFTDGRTPDAVAGLSISLPEYIADCDESLPTGNGGDGNPTFLALHISTTFRNTAAGSNISLAIDWWDHLNETPPVAPGFPRSEAGLPRATLIGYIEAFPTPVPKEMEAALESCYLAAHPDAEAWLPNKPYAPHASFWARMVVTQVYWIGGFGGLQQIGWMNVTEWKGIRRARSLPGIGDGRGWEDVRLPGEKA